MASEAFLAEKPHLFNMDLSEDRQALALLRLQKPDLEIRDALNEAIEDLFRVDFPYIGPGSPEFKNSLVEYSQHYLQDTPIGDFGVWVYFPWRLVLVHLPTEKDFFRLRTTRNRYLVTEEEQLQFASGRIAAAGLSICSSILSCLTISGGPNHISMADFDTLSITNMNRIYASVAELGLPKITNMARRLYEINPFLHLDFFPDGFNEEVAPAFFSPGGQKATVYIEAMDNIYYKVHSRFLARQLGIPVIMATDNGDNTIIDVERFDLEPDRPLFHDSVPAETLQSVTKEMSPPERIRLADAIVGPHVTSRMQQSLMSVGTRLPAWPQLGNAATLSGAAISYVTRRIITGAPMPSGRYIVSLDQQLDSTYHDPVSVFERTKLTEEFIEGFKLLYGK